jgi:hypothetical protein
MPSRQTVIMVTNQAVQDALAAAMPWNSPWPDRPVGPGGYGFSGDTIYALLNDSIDRMRRNLAMGGAQFGRPQAVPADTILGNTVTWFKQWLAFDVCRQLGI